jgi:hypothetical protein
MYRIKDQVVLQPRSNRVDFANFVPTASTFAIAWTPATIGVLEGHAPTFPESGHNTFDAIGPTARRRRRRRIDMRPASACVIKFIARLFPTGILQMRRVCCRQPVSSGGARNRPAAWAASACSTAAGGMKQKPLWWRRLTAALTLRRSMVVVEGTCCPRGCRSGISWSLGKTTRTGL